MQIVIIGAGIAGLSSYIFLSKHLLKDSSGAHSIKIFEAYDVRKLIDSKSSDSDEVFHEIDQVNFGVKTIGSAIGIGKNGLAVLGRMDDNGDVLKQIKERGNPVSRWQMGTARGWQIVDAVVESSDQSEEPKVQTVMIARQVAWEILRDKVLSIDPEAIVQQKVAAMRQAGDGTAIIEFQDGSHYDADLVIGADGLRSIVRRTMFEDTSVIVSQSWWERVLRKPPTAKDYISPHYEGLTGLGGFVPSHILKQAGYANGAMSITFGPNGFFGHGYMSPVDTDSESQDETQSTDKHRNLAAWWSTFSSDSPYPFQKIADGSGNKRGVRTDLDQEAAIHDMNERHKTWKDPIIQAILRHVTENNLVANSYPTYTTPELPTWYKDNLVLTGDAAHALQPSSGQGACQALEDSEALALLLSHYIKASNNNPKQEKQGISNALEKFVQLRKPRLAKIYKQSQKFGKMKTDMNVVQEFMMYFFIWLAGKLGAWKKYNDELFEYDVPGEVEKIVGT